MKVCAACCQELPEESFSKTQWQLRQYQRRCKEYSGANREVRAGTRPDKQTLTEEQRLPPLIITPEQYHAQFCLPRRRHKKKCDYNNYNAKQKLLITTPGASCWICLEEGPDETGERLRRDCSCRGDSGFAHLSCLTKYATHTSRDALSKKKFIYPWKTCANCHQPYLNNLSIDLASKMVDFVEEDYPDYSFNIHHQSLCVEAYHVKLHAVRGMLSLRKGEAVDEDTNNAANKILLVIGKVRALAVTPSFPSRIGWIEANTYECLAVAVEDEGTEESLQHAVDYYYYEKSMELWNEIDNNVDLRSIELKIADVKSVLDGRRNGVDKLEVSWDNQLQCAKNSVCAALQGSGEESAKAINVGISLSSILVAGLHTIEAERLLAKLTAISRRVHGSHHLLTEKAEIEMYRCKTRYAVYDWEKHQVLRYIDDDDRYVIQGPVADPKNEEEEIQKYANPNGARNGNSDLIFAPGTPIVCHGLDQHLSHC